MREQYLRWRRQQAARLNADQLVAIDDSVAFSTADTFNPATARMPVIRTRSKELDARLEALFTADEVTQLSAMTGAYIPAP